MKTKNKIITSLYDYYKNTDKKLKIICDWDEVIQSHEPHASWLTLKEQGEKFNRSFEEYFKEYWNGTQTIEYSLYGSKTVGACPKFNERQKEIKNSPNFYQQAPFLTIAEDLLKLIKKDKVEQLIFLVYCEVLDVKGKVEEKVIRDERIELVFKETFGKFPNCSLRKISHVKEKDGSGVEIQWEKTEWIKENASDFDIVIDDNPNICKSLVEFVKEVTARPSNYPIIAPYYPAVENQHHKKVLLVKNEVSNLKKEDFE